MQWFYFLLQREVGAGCGTDYRECEWKLGGMCRDRDGRVEENRV